MRPLVYVILVSALLTGASTSCLGLGSGPHPNNRYAMPLPPAGAAPRGDAQSEDLKVVPGGIGGLLVLSYGISLIAVWAIRSSRQRKPDMPQGGRSLIAKEPHRPDVFP